MGLKKTAIVLSAALLATGSAAVAANSDSASSASEGGEDAQKEKRVCKSEKITGSLTRVRRICMTQREWDELARQTARDIDELGRQRNRQDAASVGQSGGI